MDTKPTCKKNRSQGDTDLHGAQEANHRRENLRREEEVRMLLRVLTRVDKRKIREQKREMANLRRYRRELTVEITEFQRETRALEELTKNYSKRNEELRQVLVGIQEKLSDMKDEQQADKEEHESPRLKD
jgi:hypothetical protein